MVYSPEPLRYPWVIGRRSYMEIDPWPGDSRLSYTSAVFLPAGKQMSDQPKTGPITRRRFGILAAASAAATALTAQEVQHPNAPSTRLAPGSFQRPLVTD